VIQIGDVLTLEPRDNEKFERYKCKVVDIRGNDILIDYPISLKSNRSVFLLDGSQLKATFVGPDGSSVYLFETEIKGKLKQNIPMLILSYPGTDHLIKIQRRQFVRVEAAIDAALHPLNDEFIPLTALTDDISAGGAAVLVPESLEVKQGLNLMVWLVVPFQNGEYHYMKLPSRIIRVIPHNEVRKKLSIQFSDISSHERQILLRLCFEKQLGMKKKGLTT